MCWVIVARLDWESQVLIQKALETELILTCGPSWVYAFKDWAPTKVRAHLIKYLVGAFGPLQAACWRIQKQTFLSIYLLSRVSTISQTPEEPILLSQAEDYLDHPLYPTVAVISGSLLFFLLLGCLWSRPGKQRPSSLIWGGTGDLSYGPPSLPDIISIYLYRAVICPEHSWMCPPKTNRNSAKIQPSNKQR